MEQTAIENKVVLENEWGIIRYVEDGNYIHHTIYQDVNLQDVRDNMLEGNHTDEIDYRCGESRDAINSWVQQSDHHQHLAELKDIAEQIEPRRPEHGLLR